MRPVLSLRATGFERAIVVANYYSPDYNDGTQTGIVQLLNQALSTAAAAHGAVVADTFSAFRAAVSSPFAAGSPCRAGLLNALPANASVTSLAKEVGDIDILVNNAGFAVWGPTETLEIASFDAMFAANVRAPFFLGNCLD